MKTIDSSISVSITILRILTCCAGLAFTSTGTFANLDWQEGEWGIRASSSGTPGSPSCTISYPGGSKTGNALEVYFQVSPTDVPQLWVFLSDGFWRQIARESEFLTSYRLFRYYSSANEPSDNPMGIAFEVIEVTPENQLRLHLSYTNNAPSGDRFDINAEVLLESPGEPTTSMTALITITNRSGYDVLPFWVGRTDLRDQWVLFGISSMYVADYLTTPLPAWYNNLDSTHAYLGDPSDTSRLNDGFSQNGGFEVSSHDTKFILTPTSSLALNHDLPHLTVSNYEWYEDFVMRDGASPLISCQHAYDPKRNHTIELLSASGLTDNLGDLLWNVTYNRNDTNMVDGDNVQIGLSLDPFLPDSIWPIGASQQIHLRLSSGEASEFQIELNEGELEIHSNHGQLEESSDLERWTDIAEDVRPFIPESNLESRYYRQRFDVLGE